MKRLIFPERTAIGLDIGARHVKAAQLRRAGEAWRLTAASVFPRSEPGQPLSPAEAARIAAVLERQGFGGRAVAVPTPREKLFTSVLELPPRGSGAPLEQIAHSEIARSAKWADAGFEMTNWEVPAPARGAEATHVMATACLNSDADAHIDVLESSGLNVVAMDAGFVAGVRGCRPLLDASGRITAVIDLGWDSVSVVLVHDGVVVYERSMAEGGLGPLVRLIADTLQGKDALETADHLVRCAGVTAIAAGAPGSSLPRTVLADPQRRLAAHLDAIAQEVRISISFANHRYPGVGVGRALVIGGGAALPGAVAQLAGILPVEVKTASPTVITECPRGLISRSLADSPALVTAIGLALATSRAERRSSETAAHATEGAAQEAAA